MKFKKRVKKKDLRFLVIFLVVLLFLLVGLIFFDNLIKKSVKSGLEGELKTLRPSGEETINEAILRESYIHGGVSPIEESKGYIIELKSEPFFKNPSGGIVYKQQLREEHTILKQQIEQNLGKNIGTDVKLLGEFEDAFNGVTLDITKEECEFLKRRIELIKECFPNLQVHVLLDKSVKVIKADSAYSGFGLTGENITIAVIDTGIDASHESLDDLDDNPLTNDPKVIGFKDFVNFKTSPYDDHGHGTHCSGIAAGTGGSTGIYKGVAPKAKLVGVKVLNSWGSGTFSDVIAGIEWTIQNKNRYNISVISMSLGASFNSDGTTPVEIAATTAVENDISFVVAAGNSGPSANTIGIPASAKKVITVGAIDNNKEIASFSSRGPTKDGRIKPEVTAPGVSITAPSANTGNQYVAFSGTSMATPHVAGVVALIKQANLNLNADEIRQLLINTSLDRGEKGPDNTYGWGVVDVLQALLTVYPQQHELLVDNIETQKVYDTKTPIKITAIIKNKGLNNETNIKVRFFVNNAEQSSRIIDFLGTNSENSIDFIYVSEKEGNFQTTVSIEPVNGENILADNNFTKEITVKDYVGKVKAVVLDSWGTGYSQYSIFPDLNENWFKYGDFLIEVDYTSFNGKETTYELLKQSKADVLIISDAWQDGGWIPGTNWEFSDSEINAIKQYVQEGHGLIITSGTLSTNAPGNVVNNMKLASLVGIDENSKPYWAEIMDDTNFDIYYLKHGLFNNMSSYNYGDYITNKDLNLSKTDPADILAKSYDGLSIITGHHYGLGNTIYFANMPEGSFGEDDKKIFYNAILWTSKKYEQKTHDLKLYNLSLDSVIKYGEIKNISANLINKGSVVESNINVKLIVDNSEAKRINIPTLAVNEIKDIYFNFSLNKTGSHVVFIEVDELNESKTYDNSIGKKVFVPKASLTGKAKDYGVDEDGDGLHDYLAIDIELNVIESDNFNLQGLLTSGLGVEFETSYAYDTLPLGLHNLTLKFNGLELRRMGLNGPYKLKNLELSEAKGKIRIDSAYNTTLYTYSQFESYPDLLVSDIIREMEDNAKIIVNQSTNIQVEIQNIGTEDASNVNVSLYQRDRENENLILVGSLTLDSVPVFEEKSVIFKITPQQIGYVNYLINVSDEADENLENNYYWFGLEVLAESADVVGYFGYVDKAIINKKIDLKADIENRGVEEAENVSVDFYEELSWDEYIFLDSQDIGNLSVDEVKKISLSLTPTRLGELRIFGNISADNEINKENNMFYGYLNVVPEGADVTGYFYSKTYPFVINQEGKIEIYLRNIGTKRADNVKATLYEDIDGTLNQIASIDAGNIESDGYYEKEVLWTPIQAGYNKLVLKITADNDANLENNEIEQNFYVRLESPDIRSYRDYSINKLILNQENNISFNIYNDGTTDAQNVIISLYKYDNILGTYTLIESKNIVNLAVYEKKEVNFSYTPTELGWTSFKINMSADNEAEEYKENNEDWFGLKVVSGADLSVYIEYITTAFINQEKNIISYLENDGAEDALNVIVSLYKYDNILGTYTLIDSKNIASLAVDKTQEINFSYTPTQLGYISFKINASADNEGNYEDNENYFGFEVVNNGPDIDVNLQTWKIDTAVVNHEVFIPAEISNIGNQDANNIQLTLYNVSWDVGEQLTQIDQKTITRLLASEKNTIEFQYTPTEAGWIGLKLVSSLVGDVYSGNDYAYSSLEVLNSLTDVSGLFLFYNSYAINNEINYLDIEVRDNDIIGAENVSVKLYDNSALINNFFISKLNSSDSVFYKNVAWVPSSIGLHNLTLIVTANEDINLENNVYTEFINVYNRRNVTFNIKNYSRAYIPRYLTINDNRFRVDSKYIAKVVESGKIDIGLSNSYYNKNFSKEVFTVFLNSGLKNEMNVTSQYYEDVVSDGLLFDIIYANSPNWSFDNSSYYTLYYNPEKTLNDASIYSCLTWNFSSLNCQTEWTKNNETSKYIGEDGVYITANSGRVSAVGFIAIEASSVTPTVCGDGSCNGGETCSSCQTDCGTCPCTTCGESPSGGGPGGGGNTNNVETKFFSDKNINESLKLNVDNSNLDIEFLGLRFVNEQEGGFVQFRKIESLKDTPILANKVYAYFSIEHTINDTNIKDGNIIFRVTKQWLEDNKFDKENVILLRYENNWRELPTHYQSSDGIYNYYRSDINALSIFAISTKQSEEIKGFWSKISPYIYILLIFMIVIVLFIIILIKIRSSINERVLISKARNFVNDARMRGFSNETIKEMFRKKRWKEKRIDKLLEK